MCGHDFICMGEPYVLQLKIAQQVLSPHQTNEVFGMTAITNDMDGEIDDLQLKQISVHSLNIAKKILKHLAGKKSDGKCSVCCSAEVYHSILPSRPPLKIMRR